MGGLLLALRAPDLRFGLRERVDQGFVLVEFFVCEGATGWELVEAKFTSWAAEVGGYMAVVAGVD